MSNNEKLREAGEYLYRYFVMPGHAKLAKDCPNKECPFCKWEAALAAGEPGEADNTISITIRGQEQVAVVMNALKAAGFVAAQAQPATAKEEEGAK